MQCACFRIPAVGAAVVREHDCVEQFRGREVKEKVSTVTCKYCGESGLTWEDDNGRWVLLHANGRVHKCKNKKQ